MSSVDMQKVYEFNSALCVFVATINLSHPSGFAVVQSGKPLRRQIKTLSEMQTCHERRQKLLGTPAL